MSKADNFIVLLKISLKSKVTIFNTSLSIFLVAIFLGTLQD